MHKNDSHFLQRYLRRAASGVIFLTLGLFLGAQAPWAQETDEAEAKPQYGKNQVFGNAQVNPSRIFLGGMIGLAHPTSRKSQLQFGYGGSLGVKFDDFHSVAGYFLTSRQEVEFVETRFTFWGAEYAYYFPEGVNIGLRAGAARERMEGQTSSSTRTSFSLGPKVGYDLSLGVISVGLETDMLFAFPKGMNYEVIHLLGVLKYWL